MGRTPGSMGGTSSPRRDFEGLAVAVAVHALVLGWVELHPIPVVLGPPAREPAKEIEVALVDELARPPVQASGATGATEIAPPSKRATPDRSGERRASPEPEVATKASGPSPI